MEKKDLIDKWLNDELTQEEFEVLRTLPEFSSYQKINTWIQDLETPDPQTEERLIELKSKLRSEASPKRSLFATGRLLRIAATIALVLASYYFLTSNDATTFQTEMAETKEVMLPDASKIWLNESSSITFNKENWNEDRTVKLTGEAYFEVAKGETFTVISDKGSVEVLGTKFNVSDNIYGLLVNCYEGKVKVTLGDNTRILTRGQGVQSDEDRLSSLEVFTTTPGWLNNESTFDDALITDVLQVLATTYKTDIATENIDVTLRYTGSFPNDNLEGALKAITLPLKLEYQIDSSSEIKVFTPAE